MPPSNLNWTPNYAPLNKGAFPVSTLTSTLDILALRSSQPPLPAAVVLHVLEAPSRARGDSEIELLDVLVRGELGGRAVHDHAAVLEDVAVIGVAQRDVGVLFGEQKTYLLLLIEALHDLEDLLDDLRRKPHRRL